MEIHTLIGARKTIITGENQNNYPIEAAKPKKKYYSFSIPKARGMRFYISMSFSKRESKKNPS